MLVLKTNPANHDKVPSYLDSQPFIMDKSKVKTIYDISVKEHSIAYTGTSERFCDWGISDWEIYFGFATPIYLPYFELTENGRGSNMPKVRY